MSPKKKRIKRKSKAKKLDQIITGVFSYWIAFITVMIVIFCVKDSVPDTLVQYGLGGGAVELLISGLIEIFRKKYGVSATTDQIAPSINDGLEYIDDIDDSEEGRG